MDLTDLQTHIAEIDAALKEKRSQLDGLLLRDPGTGMQVRYQIECLEPRVAELKRQALRMSKEQEAAASEIAA